MKGYNEGQKWRMCRKMGLGPSIAKYWLRHGKCEVEGCNNPSDVPILLLDDVKMNGAFALALCQHHQHQFTMMGALEFAQLHRQFIPKVRSALASRRR